MTSTHVFDILFCGNYTKDTIITPEGSRGVDGGGFNYGAHAAVGLGANVAAITRLAAGDSHVIANLNKQGITVYPTIVPTSTHMILDYPTTNPDERILTSPHTAGSYTLDQFDGIEAKRLLINSSMREEMPLAVIEGLRPRFEQLVGDLQGFIRVIAPDRRLVYEQWPEKEAILGLLDVLKTDQVEAEFLTGESDMRRAARALAEFGPKEIVLTHKDGIVVYDGSQFYEAPFHSKKIVGRSGRGDTCIASYIAKRLTLPPKEAIIWSAAVTSLKMEADSPFLKSVADVEKLIRTKYRA
ncbi:PfkB family carbohydrate kinase [Candidatus Neomarinimicrobiota bacterium]